MDRQLSEFFFFFEWLAKVKSLVTVACFLPGRAKDLSAPWYRGCINVRRTLYDVWDRYSSVGVQTRLWNGWRDVTADKQAPECTVVT